MEKPLIPPKSQSLKIQTHMFKRGPNGSSLAAAGASHSPTSFALGARPPRPPPPLGRGSPPARAARAARHPKAPTEAAAPGPAASSRKRPKVTRALGPGNRLVEAKGRGKGRQQGWWIKRVKESQRKSSCCKGSWKCSLAEGENLQRS